MLELKLIQVSERVTGVLWISCRGRLWEKLPLVLAKLRLCWRRRRYGRGKNWRRGGRKYRVVQWCESIQHVIACSFLPLSPPGWRGIVVTVWAVGWSGGCQTCGTNISITAWRIFSIRSSVELSRPLVVHCYDHLPICPTWACPWAKNLSNLLQIGSRFCGSHIFENAGWMYPI